MVIDALSFALNCQVLEGQVRAGELLRLCEGLPMPQDARISWRLGGRRDDGLPGERGPVGWLDIHVRGAVRVICQRCLEPFDLPLGVDNTLRLLENEAQLEQMDTLETQGHGPQTDYLVAQSRMDVLELVEDELILAVPYAPRHDVCPRSATGSDALQGQGRPSPFAALSRLHKH